MGGDRKDVEEGVAEECWLFASDVDICNEIGTRVRREMDISPSPLRNLLGPSLTSGFGSHVLSLLAEIVGCLVGVALHPRPVLDRWLLPRLAPKRVIPLDDRFVQGCLLTRLVVGLSGRLVGYFCLALLGAFVSVSALLCLNAILLLCCVSAHGLMWEERGLGGGVPVA